MSLRSSLQCLGWITVVGSLLTIPNLPDFIFEINRNLGAYYLVSHCAVLCSLGLLFRGSYRQVALLMAFLAALTVWQGAPMLRFYRAQHPGEEIGNRYREYVFLFAQLDAGTSSRDRLLAHIARLTPELIGLIQPPPSLELPAGYEHRLEVPGNDGLAIALYSKHPFHGTPTTSMGEDTSPVILAALDGLTEPPLSVVLFSTRPPLSAEALQRNKLVGRRVATLLRHNLVNVVMATNLSATPYSPYYQIYDRVGAFYPIAQGGSFTTLWRQFNPLPDFEVQHIFYRGIRLRLPKEELPLSPTERGVAVVFELPQL